MGERMVDNTPTVRVVNHIESGQFLVIPSSNYYSSNEILIVDKDGKEYRHTGKDSFSMDTEPFDMYYVTRTKYQDGYTGAKGEFLSYEDWEVAKRELLSEAYFDDEERKFIFDFEEQEEAYNAFKNYWKQSWGVKEDLSPCKFATYVVNDRDEEYAKPVLSLSHDASKTVGLYHLVIPAAVIEKKIRDAFTEAGFRIDKTWTAKVGYNGEIIYDFFTKHDAFGTSNLKWRFDGEWISTYEKVVEKKKEIFDAVDKAIENELQKYNTVDAATKKKIQEHMSRLGRHIGTFAPSYSASQKKRSAYASARSELQAIQGLIQ
jgi:hypothetical protein